MEPTITGMNECPPTTGAVLCAQRASFYNLKHSCCSAVLLPLTIELKRLCEYIARSRLLDWRAVPHQLRWECARPPVACSCSCLSACVVRPDHSKEQVRSRAGEGPALSTELGSKQSDGRTRRTAGGECALHGRRLTGVKAGVISEGGWLPPEEGEFGRGFEAGFWSWVPTVFAGTRVRRLWRRDIGKNTEILR